MAVKIKKDFGRIKMSKQGLIEYKTDFRSRKDRTI